MSTARADYTDKIGTTSAAIAAGGEPVQATVEEWTVSSVFQQENLGQVFYNSTSNAFKVTKQSVSSGTWASGGTYPSPVLGSGGFGTQTAAVGIGGQLPPATPGSTNATNNYDGTSWTSSGNYPTSTYYLFGAGTQTAGLAAGGGGPPFSTASFEYDGSTWSNPATMNIGRSYAIYNVGTQTAAYYFGGFIPSDPNATTTENYNGTSWSPGTNINTAREASAGFGIQTSAIMAGGTNPPGRVNNVESWNGTSWTEIAEINTARSYVGGGGNNNSSGIIFGGQTATASTASTEYWNGTTWTEINDLSTATNNVGNLGSDTAALSFGGTTPTPTNATQSEEFSAVTVNSTLTAS
jgi:hypothetical protein